MPSFSIASARARMPRPDVFSERKSSSMMTIGKRNFMDSSKAKCRASKRRGLLVTALTKNQVADGPKSIKQGGTGTCCLSPFQLKPNYALQRVLVHGWQIGRAKAGTGSECQSPIFNGRR